MSAQIYDFVSNGDNKVDPITGIPTQLQLQTDVNTCETNVMIGEQPINADEVNTVHDFGDYDTMDFRDGSFWRSWTDNTDDMDIPPVGDPENHLELATRRVDVFTAS